jgi:hypothetical protein
VQIPYNGETRVALGSETCPGCSTQGARQARVAVLNGKKLGIHPGEASCSSVDLKERVEYASKNLAALLLAGGLPSGDPSEGRVTSHTESVDRLHVPESDRM